MRLHPKYVPNKYKKQSETWLVPLMGKFAYNKNQKFIPCTRADPQSDSDILNSSLTLASSSFSFSAEDMLSGWKYCIDV